MLRLFWGPAWCSKRGICNMYGFIDTFLYVSFITFIHHKQTCEDLVSQLQFSVYIELSVVV